MPPTLHELDKKMAVLDSEVLEVKSDVTQIKGDIRKVVWLVIAAVVMALLNFTLGGGLATVAHIAQSQAAPIVGVHETGR